MRPRRGQRGTSRQGEIKLRRPFDCVRCGAASAGFFRGRGPEAHCNAYVSHTTHNSYAGLYGSFRIVTPHGVGPIRGGSRAMEKILLVGGKFALLAPRAAILSKMVSNITCCNPSEF